MSKMPAEVYYRCIWLVRDSKRLELLAELSNAEYGCEESQESAYTGTCESPIIAGESHNKRDLQLDDETDPGGWRIDMESSVIVSEEVVSRAEIELACIRAAIMRVPSAYRQGIIDNIASRKPFDDTAHPNTWKKWKQTFIYQLAKELHLI